MIRIKKYEAFRAGKAGEVINKFSRVISRKVGKPIELSPETYDYSNKYGTFSGYFATIGDGEQMLRFNFSLGKSDEIISIDVYDSLISIEPDYTVDTKGENIIQILDQVVNIIEGKSVIIERTKRGSKETVLKGAETEDFNYLMQFNAEEQFEQLKDFIYAIYRGLANSLYLYGQPGTGKSFTVEEELNKLNAEYELISGEVEGIEGLVKVLYDNRDNSIIVFDDLDTIMRKAGQKAILKKVLQNDPVRNVTYISKNPDKQARMGIPTSFEFTSAIIFISNLTKIDSAIRSRSLTLNIQMSIDEALMRIREVIDKLYPNFPLDIKMKVWRFLKRAAKEKKIKTIDFRQFQFCIITSAVVLNKYPTSAKWKKKCLAMLNA